MKINKVVGMYHYSGEISHPPSPPDVLTVKGILSYYIFLFFDTPDHYFMRKYSSWCKSCSLVRGCGYGCDVFDC